MNRMRFALAGAYLLIGAIAAAYLAGCLYFILSKAMPNNIELDTWWRYWDAYAADAAQRKRLLTAAVLAAGVVFLIPLAAMFTLVQSGRSLHGDARWATRAEIRKAGLL